MRPPIKPPPQYRETQLNTRTDNRGGKKGDTTARGPPLGVGSERAKIGQERTDCEAGMGSVREHRAVGAVQGNSKSVRARVRTQQSIHANLSKNKMSS